MSFSLSYHNNSKRVRVIKLNESDLDRLIFPFKKHSILSLEYKPFSRFSLAKSLDEVFQNKLSKTLSEILNDRSTGTAIVEPDINNKKFKTACQIDFIDNGPGIPDDIIDSIFFPLVSSKEIANFVLSIKFCKSAEMHANYIFYYPKIVPN